MRFIKAALLVTLMTFAGYCQLINYGNGGGSTKSIMWAVVAQCAWPGLGNLYIEGNWVKPIVYPLIIFGFGGSAVWLSNTSFQYKEPFVYTGFAVSLGTFIFSHVDLINTCIKDGIPFFKFSLKPNSISLTYDF